MKIRNRAMPVLTDGDTPKVSSFPDIVAKPKEPLEPGGPLTTYLDQFPQDTPLSRSERLGRFPMIVKNMGDNLDDINFTVADKLEMVRSSYDHKNPQEQRYRNRVRNRNTAITAACMVCTGSRKLVTECADCTCPLWPFRFGRSPYRGK